MILYNYYIAILIISLIFFIISKLSVNILITIIIIIIISYFYYNKIIQYDNININNEKNKIDNINKDIKERKYINNEIYYLKKIPENIKYLYKDKQLLNIILNIKFIKKYDFGKYTNIIYYIDKFYKIYIYILADRYDINKYFNILIDLRNTIISELYSIYIILPLKMKYYYGFDSFTELEKSIKDFIQYSRKLITIIENFGFKEKKIYYLYDSKYKPYNSINKYEVN